MVGFFFKLQSLTCSSHHGNVSIKFVWRLLMLNLITFLSLLRLCLFRILHEQNRKHLHNSLHSLTSSIAQKYKTHWTAWKQLLQSVFNLLTEVEFLMMHKLQMFIWIPTHVNKLYFTYNKLQLMHINQKIIYFQEPAQKWCGLSLIFLFYVKYQFCTGQHKFISHFGTKT